MRNKEIIINDSLKFKLPPDDYNLLEIHCFLALKKLLYMYRNNQINKDRAAIIKQKILADYEARKVEYEFQSSIYQEHIQHIKNTENARIKLHKILNGEADGEITEEKLCEVIDICMQIISEVFKGEF